MQKWKSFVAARHNKRVVVNLLADWKEVSLPAYTCCQWRF